MRLATASQILRTRTAVTVAAASMLAVVSACGGAESNPVGGGGAGLATSGGGSGGTEPAGGSGGAGAGDTGGSGGASTGLNVSKLAIGAPAFDLVDFQLFSATLGTENSEFIERADTLEGVLPDHEFLLDFNVLGPSTAKEPPYLTELHEGMLLAGYETADRYTAADWAAPQGIYFAATVVPAAGAPTGRSTDFDSGPIIATAAFPITVDMDLWKGGAVLDQEFDFDYPTVNDLVPGADVDGYSHIPLFFWRNSDLIVTEPDTYQFRLRIVDAQGNGWRVYVPFYVE